MRVLVLLMSFVVVGCSSNQSFYECEGAVPYVKFGASYKQYENRMVSYSSGKRQVIDVSPIGGRFETGIDCGTYRVGYYHSSDIFTGAPFNDSDRERMRDEFFIDYVIKFEPLR
jgi:hypothetical protein